MNLGVDDLHPFGEDFLAMREQDMHPRYLMAVLFDHLRCIGDHYPLAQAGSAETTMPLFYESSKFGTLIFDDCNIKL